MKQFYIEIKKNSHHCSKIIDIKKITYTYYNNSQQLVVKNVKLKYNLTINNSNNIINNYDKYLLEDSPEPDFEIWLNINIKRLNYSEYVESVNITKIIYIDENKDFDGYVLLNVF